MCSAEVVELASTDIARMVQRRFVAIRSFQEISAISARKELFAREAYGAFP